MDDKQYKEAFNNNVPDGYDADTYIIICPVCSKEFQASPGDAVCPECGAELSFTIEDKQIYSFHHRQKITYSQTADYR